MKSPTRVDLFSAGAPPYLLGWGLLRILFAGLESVCNLGLRKNSSAWYHYKVDYLGSLAFCFVASPAMLLDRSTSTAMDSETLAFANIAGFS